MERVSHDSVKLKPVLRVCASSLSSVATLLRCWFTFLLSMTNPSVLLAVYVNGGFKCVLYGFLAGT